ncbi:unnamed protein product [Caenorhabditis bovis]|uniref:Uncharacterized protein n=1 Tax=Caenorhabditis bovis TaxID=2654633 RepID=A0A8S1E7R7_9PELO|nr:unnamed protein product [Caenorhabditis bovis]
MNQRLVTFESGCAPNRHTLTIYQNNIVGAIPAISMFLNICLIFYLKFNHTQVLTMVARVHASGQRGSVDRTTSQNYETTLMFQSIYTTAVLLTYEISATLIDIFWDEYSRLSLNTQSWIFYSRISMSCLINVLVYGVGTTSTRKLLVETFHVFIRNRKFVKIRVSSILPMQE